MLLAQDFYKVADCQLAHEIAAEYLEGKGIDEWQNLYDDGYLEDMEDMPEDVGFTVRFGATKIVLIPQDEDFVVKIPIYGDAEWGGAFWTGAASPELSKRGYDVDCNDYCELESCFYECAREEGVEQFFVPTYYGGMIGDIPYYLQPRITFIYSKATHSNGDEYTYASINGSDAIDPDVGAELLMYYTVEDVARFLAFINLFGINDLSAKRNGWYTNEYHRYVFWDYAGFHD